jgi:hypothetical protein
MPKMNEHSLAAAQEAKDFSYSLFIRTFVNWAEKWRVL